MTKTQIETKGKPLSFFEVKELIGNIPVEAGRTGIFDVKINNRGKKYHFEKLKENFTTENFFGFGLNHYGWLGLKKQDFKQSKFHDNEDVSIDVNHRDFISAFVFENNLSIKTRTFQMLVSW
jgi:hypothetical protein